MRGDLHIHSNVSDGSMSRDEIIESAKKKNLDSISITDHDFILSVEESESYINKYKDIRLIPGIEISAYDFKRKRKVHILGYNFNLEGSNIKELCKGTLKKRQENSLRQLNTIISEGYDIDKWEVLEKVSGSGVLYKQHIMEALVKAGYTNNIYSYLYKKLFKGNGICKGDIHYVDAKDAIAAIKKDGGLAVLAHPGELDSFDIIPELVEEGLEGIERNHPSHKLNDLILVDKYCYEFGLLKTGGSDFHGIYGTVKDLGTNLCPIDSLNLILNKR